MSITLDVSRLDLHTSSSELLPALQNLGSSDIVFAHTPCPRFFLYILYLTVLPICSPVMLNLNHMLTT